MYKLEILVGIVVLKTYNEHSSRVPEEGEYVTVDHNLYHVDNVSTNLDNGDVCVTVSPMFPEGGEYVPPVA